MRDFQGPQFLLVGHRERRGSFTAFLYDSDNDS